ncbi:hypothetical protein [Shinella zoogloeoides]|uniref:hypothetical protein n=1 Tax=Shinella zoogloeoides TaxID=352475 RepID=UPI000E65763B|nr:hypothetical protein [Shinella zoogloeoides]
MEQFIISGAILSTNCALIPPGLTLIFGIMNVLNFARSRMFMIGSLVVYWVCAVYGMPYGVRLTGRKENSMLLAVGTAFVL